MAKYTISFSSFFPFFCNVRAALQQFLCEALFTQANKDNQGSWIQKKNVYKNKENSMEKSHKVE